MHYEAQTIYKRGRSYVLVMCTSISSIHMAYIDHKYQYAMLPELKVDDIGYVEFDRIHNIPWYKLGNNVEVSVYRKMSDRQFNAVINALSNMYTGIIINHKNLFMYADEVPEKRNTTPIIFEPDVNEEPSIPDAEEPTTFADEDRIEEANEEPVSIECENDNTDTSQCDLSQYDTEMVDECIIENGDGSILYDLLYYEKKSATDNRSKYPAKKKSKKSNTEQTQRMLFTKDEALSIAVSTTPVIASRYSVDNKTASRLRRNARKLFGFEIDTRCRSIDYKGMLESNMTPEDIAEATNTPLAMVLKYMANHKINKNATSDGIENMRRYVDGLIADKKYKELDDLYSMTKCELCEKYNISSNTYHNIRIKIYQALALNPLYPVFGIDGYDPNLIDKLNSSRKTSTSTIRIDIYNKVMSLWDIYYRTLNNHSKFLSGMINPADYTDADNIDFLMAMVWNRFNRQRITDNRIFSRMQKECIKNNDFYGFCTRFIINPDKAYNILAHIRKKMLAGKDGK